MRFIDRYFYKPSIFQKILVFLFLPISLIYYVSSILRRKASRSIDFEIPIISVGNLIAGGSGKTPFIIEIAKEYMDVAIISRGYKRKSKGLVIVSQNGKIMCAQKEAGDEAYLIAKKLKNATVIVSKKRALAIQKAKELGCKAIFLDDGFRFNFKKLNILLKPKLEPYFKLCIPSGMYRERPSLYKIADILAIEGVDYKRKVKINNQTQRMLLVTAIANPSRLDEYLPDTIGKITLNDHSDFNMNQLQIEFQKHSATSILVTQKDEVKLKDSPIPLSIMELELEINPNIKKSIYDYIHSY
ncbi:tetraacyldisaccharide 4'-kinase [Helicobacter sp. 13S00482-2]|uniref:tetraacyldisaccharide 4'-kinase n=1 Tax=Helicobacter sp. 13S00482-2 TaxID=1476200 RepID=UPI000BA51C0B|nr:tetraacyldisaccharide 4'-kinase [Helicobacter sp. 13S00482-2]PAF54132.1 tetraacyldisaccharide 4'-kinase [Helicobacter sp. 13S00482-2]